MSVREIAENLLRLAKDASPAGWEAETWCSDMESNRWAAIGPVHTQSFEEEELDPGSLAAEEAEADAKWIAAANPQAIKALCERLIKLEALAISVRAYRDTNRELGITNHGFEKDLDALEEKCNS